MSLSVVTYDPHDALHSVSAQLAPNELHQLVLRHSNALQCIKESQVAIGVG